MLVRVDGDYTLSQDGVIWSAIGVEDGADLFVVSSPGRISIKVGNKEVFYFLVVFDEDFTIGKSMGIQYDADNNIIDQVVTTGSYYQSVFKEGINRLRMYVRSGVMSIDDIMSLGLNVNQPGCAVVPSKTNNDASWVITNFDISRYLEVRAGNVLIGFILPRA